ncbi:MAG: hypothetical protein OSB10_06620, partial [Planctomycetota bacterium]|nr:hypothetical protein [Planctomycetota bacterium]
MSISTPCHPIYGGSGVATSELTLCLAGREPQVHPLSHAVPPRPSSAGRSVSIHLGFAACQERLLTESTLRGKLGNAGEDNAQGNF